MFEAIGAHGRRLKARKRIEAELRAGGDAQALIAALKPYDRGPVVAAVVDALLFDDAEALALAVVEAALALQLRDDDSLLAAERVFIHANKLERALQVCELALDPDPDRELWLQRYAATLITADRADEALQVLDDARLHNDTADLSRAKALFALHRNEQALALAEELVERCYARMQASFGSEHAKQQYHQAQSLHATLQGELHGAETVVLASARAARLDAKAAVNYRLLADSLMVESSYRPERTALLSPEQELERAAHLPAGGLAHAIRGSGELRLGRIGLARKSFEAACATDGRSFPGLRGLGAVVAHEQYGLLRLVRQLPELTLPRGSEALFPDWPALTELEQRVVAASAVPIASQLPALVAAGARTRLLPIDVRTVDLPEWQATGGARFADDHRAMDALGGVADPEAMLAVARIEELPDLVSRASFTFAHELAHLAYFHASEALRAQVLALYERVLAEPYLAGEYQRKNEHEFFAVSYQDYLRVRYDMPQHRIEDAEGVLADTIALFDGLG